MLSTDSVCVSCTKPVFRTDEKTGEKTGENIAVVGRNVFHESCLKCAQCGQQLQSFCQLIFVPKSTEEWLDGDLSGICSRATAYCASCTSKRQAESEKCEKCKNGFKLRENTVHVVAGKLWHDYCFTCMNPACNRKISREYFSDDTNDHYCSVKCQRTVSSGQLQMIASVPAPHLP